MLLYLLCDYYYTYQNTNVLLNYYKTGTNF